MPDSKPSGKMTQMKRTLKEFDRHNVLGDVEIEELSIDDILNDEEDYGLLDTDKETIYLQAKKCA